MEGIQWRVSYGTLAKSVDIDAEVIKEKELAYQKWLQNNKGLLQTAHPDILEKYK